MLGRAYCFLREPDVRYAFQDLRPGPSSGRYWWGKLSDGKEALSAHLSAQALVPAIRREWQSVQATWLQVSHTCSASGAVV